MKQRITYFLPEGKRVDPEDVHVGSDTLNFTKAHEAAEEWRLTLSLHDLPDEVRYGNTYAHAYNAKHMIDTKHTQPES